MIFNTGLMGLKAALYARRKRMGRAARTRYRKSPSWLYPWSTERRYGAAIRAWLRPLKSYVREYLKNNQAAILRGDSASLLRQDAIPGGSYRRMVRSLYGWHSTYFPPINESGTRDAPPHVFLGLGNIAESMNDFNARQWDKAARAELGIEFPVFEEWWPETKMAWQDENYRLLKNLGESYIQRVNLAVEEAVTSGMSPAQLAKKLNRISDITTKSRANLIARDQIGKLNGQVTQARMKAVNLELYEWSTSADERVRDSHSVLEGMICRWDNPKRFFRDGGKSWEDRPASWSQAHSGQDIQCRCTALSYWAELIGEVDRQIDREERSAGDF